MNVVVPAESPAGRARVRLLDGAGEIAAGETDIAPSPGIFVTDPLAVNRPAAILNQDSGRNEESAPARRGDVVQIFATGAGASPRVFFGLVEAEVVWNGVLPQFPGAWQINARVPDPATVTRQMPVVVVVAGAQSNGATVWVE